MCDKFYLCSREINTRSLETGRMVKAQQRSEISQKQAVKSDR